MKDNLSDYERYLKPVHLKGKEVILTIVRFTEEETHPQRGQAKTALVAWFRELPFGLILSPTNRAALMDTCDSLAGWIGKPIVVKSVSIGKVGPTPRSPIRIVNTRPAAPSLDTATGEILPEPPAPVAEVVYSESHGPEWAGNLGESSELDAHFGAPKITAPDFCTSHNVTMTETSPKTGLPFHRITEDGRIGFCNGVEVKFSNGHAAGGR